MERDLNQGQAKWRSALLGSKGLCAAAVTSGHTHACFPHINHCSGRCVWIDCCNDRPGPLALGAPRHAHGRHVCASAAFTRPVGCGRVESNLDRSEEWYGSGLELAGCYESPRSIGRPLARSRCISTADEAKYGRRVQVLRPGWRQAGPDSADSLVASRSLQLTPREPCPSLLQANESAIGGCVGINTPYRQLPLRPCPELLHDSARPFDPSRPKTTCGIDEPSSVSLRGVAGAG